MNGSASEKIAEAFTRQLMKAWNAGSGSDFAASFATDADFVNIRGEYHTGQAAIAAGHQQVLDTIYKGSQVAYHLKRARYLANGAVVAQVEAQLHVPAGPVAGDHQAMYTMVLAVTSPGIWQVVALQNTLVTEQPMGPGQG